MKNQITPEIKARIKELLSSTDNGGMCTEDIAHNLGLTNRQVGAIMGALRRKGLVRTYTKGAIVLNGGLHSRSGAKVRLSNSYYEWI